MKLALFGYPAAGKTFLAEALAGRSRESYDPFRPALSIAEVEDARLRDLSALTRPKKVSPARVELLDFRGVSRDGACDERVFAELGLADFILLVADGHSGAVRPENDLASLGMELVFRDLQRLGALREKRAAEIAAGRRRPVALEAETTEKAIAWLESERCLSHLELSPAEKVFLNSLGLITLRKTLGVISASAGGETGRALDARFPGAAEPTACASPGAFWGYALEAFDTIIFYTIGDKENRAWLLPRGGTARDAAFSIHTDIGRGFIRAEVIACADFLRAGSWPACRQRGCMRLEGRDYPVSDGDIINIRCTA